MSVESMVERFIIDELTYGNKENISYNESLLDSGILDSLGLLRLISFLEERYGISIGDGEVVPENFETIESIRNFITHKKQVR